MKLPKFAEVRKLAAAVLGFAAEAVASGLLSGTALHVAQIVLAVATVAGVYVAPNGAILRSTVGKVAVGQITAHLHLDTSAFHAKIAEAKQVLANTPIYVTTTADATTAAAPVIYTQPILSSTPPATVAPPAP